MAPTLSLAARSLDMARASTPSPTPVHSSAIVFATMSLLIVLLIIPPMCWHYRNRNIGATVLVAWTILMNLQSFINAIIWSRDNTHTWYNGSGLCDVEVKLQVAGTVAAPAALACMLRALANAMDTNRATLIKSEVQRRRDYAIDLSCCIGFPLLQMLMHYIVQDRRYYVWGIAGCVPSVSNSWLSILLINIPPPIWTLIDGYYAILIIIRICRYRRTFTSVMASSNTSKSRFVRLYLMCLVLIFGFIPVQVYLLYVNLAEQRIDFSWDKTHDPATWNDIVMVSSGGKILFDRWIWFAPGVIILIFFGLGKEAVAMYRSTLLAIGFGKVIPSWRLENNRRSFETGKSSSFGSQAKLFFKRNSSMSSTHSDSVVSHAQSLADSQTPKGITLLETISEDQYADKKSSLSTRQAVLSRIKSVFKTKETGAHQNSEFLTMADLSGQSLTVQSNVSVGLSSPVLWGNGHTKSMEVTVRKEVIQASEMA